MTRLIKIKKGLDIGLIGDAEKHIGQIETTSLYALKPPDFHAVRPKLMVKPGDSVKAGSPLFFDKDNEKVIFCSPVSGTVKDVVRGEKRVILEVVIEADGKNDYVSFSVKDIDSLNRDEIIENMLAAGVWPYLRQRPWDRIAKPEDTPKSVFISSFDSAPLAPDYEFIVSGQEELFQAGINVLRKLSNDKLYLGVKDKGAEVSLFEKFSNAEIYKVKGPHPAGNVGVQIHRVDPLTKYDVVWYCNPQDVLTIGRLFTEGIYKPEKIFCLTGSEVVNPKYYKGLNGLNLTELFEKNTIEGNNRYISGNVLTGSKISKNSFIGFYDHQLTVIPEGNYYEFFGWIDPGFNKFSTSGAIASKWLAPRKKRRLNTNLHGGLRAYIMTGEYERVFPFDIYPNQLIKAILVEDIDLMEKLGIYEIAPEDFALCEVICTSKTNVQYIVHKGIDLMIKELG